jgi:DNA-directed RNA polymerase subunit E"
MAKKKACKKCKMLVEGDECPICKTSNFTTIFQGRVSIVDPSKSEVAKKMEIHEKGDYAIKTRG